MVLSMGFVLRRRCLSSPGMHDRYQSAGIGVQFIDGGALQAIASPQSLTWQVPSTLEGEELLLVVDNTDSPLGGGNERKHCA